MADQRVIGFVDSGIGGLPYLQWAAEHLPGERFAYVADRANFPYGPKSHDEVLRAVVSAVRGLLAAEDPKLVVVACNTASVVALAGLREGFPGLPFVGTVPAVKPAAERSRSRRFGLLATERTLRDPYLEELLHRFAAGHTVVKLAGPDIVSFVERRLFASGSRERREIIQEAALRFREAGVDSVVLGCTHFMYVREELAAELGPGIEIIDSTEGVGRQMVKVLEKEGLCASTAAFPKEEGCPEIPRPLATLSGDHGRMYVTGAWPPEDQYAEFSRRFLLDFAGTLPGS